jgi:hypothetical protein
LGGRIRDKLCRWRLLWGRKGTSGSNLARAGQLCYTTCGEGEVGGSSRIHVEKVKRGLAAKRGRKKRVLTVKRL